jgi:excisionase family DNA binding protein
MEDKLLSIEDVAARLGGISLWTVRAWLSQGRLMRTKVGGRTMVRESELQRVMEDGGKSPALGRNKHKKVSAVPVPDPDMNW